jgi:hypothetical protein
MVSNENFFGFWSKAISSLQEHPDDEAALKTNPHGFPLDTLVGPWMGPIRTAPVIILTLNGNLVGNGEEARAAQMPVARAFAAHNLTGDAPLPDWHAIGNPAGLGWTTGRLTQFELSYKDAADKVAFVNLIAYKSKDGSKHMNMRMANKLPSSLMMQAWMRDTIFPEAEAGERLVICLRSHRAWDLEPGTQRGESLFAPKCTRGGHMAHGEMREKICLAVRRAVFD